MRHPELTLMTATTDKSTRPNTDLYIIAFTSGMATLAIELTASRLLGSVFGTSNLIWANVIGLILLYLTVGYFIGGRIADRYPRRSIMYTLILWGAFLSMLIPLVARPVLQAAAQAVVGVEASLALGSFIAVLVLFSVPLTLLGTTSPFAIRLAVADVEKTGRIAGQIYAVSTVGSLIGTFLPTLFIIPELGTVRTFLLFGGILFGVAFIGLWREIRLRALVWLWMPLVVLLAAFAVLSGPLRPPPANTELLYEDESAYNYIQVIEDNNGARYLYLNEGQGIHSQWHPTQITYDRTWSFFLTAPYFNDSFTPDEMQSLMVVGLAAGTIPRQYIAVYGDIPIDGIEIDPGIIEAGERYFQMNETHMPSLTTYAQDGRYVLNQLDGDYTVIGVDAYKAPYIPWHLTTIEFFQEVHDHLAANGVLAINVGRTSTDRRFVDALTHTIGHIFPSIHAMDVPKSFNTILIASKQPTSAANLQANLARLPADASPLLRQALALGTESLVPADVNASDMLFTDDRAPVETLVDSLVLNFLLSGNLDEVR